MSGCSQFCGALLVRVGNDFALFHADETKTTLGRLAQVEDAAARHLPNFVITIGERNAGRARFRAVEGFDETFITSEDREICARWRARGGALTYATEAVVRHSHHLTLRTLWRQHFGYGRGALRFHRATSEGGNFKPDLTFYRKLLSSGSTETRLPRAAQLTALVLWSQVANAAGFFYEKYQAARVK